MKNITKASLILLTSFFIISCGNNEKETDEDKALKEIEELYGIDLDEGKVGDKHEDVKSDIVKIGNQTWMTRNLNVTSFQNGDELTEAKTEKEWEDANFYKKPAYCSYENDPINDKLFGKFYNIHAVLDERGLAPAGYHVATMTEWNELIEFVGGREGNAKLQSKYDWKNENENNNSTRFTAMPAGVRSQLGTFKERGDVAVFWTAKELSDNDASGHYTSNKTIIVLHSGSVSPGIEYAGDRKKCGFSVRCIQGLLAEKKTNSTMLATFEYAEFGDFYHLVFKDEAGEEWDFGSGDNNYGGFVFGEEESNPDLVGKKFKIVWSGDRETPSIIKIEKI